ncbi:MarR family transcriptional regulator [Oenococcus oeni]|uniref:MarR family winged helix-turn-helix transcriptional regulator n=1 Tax=Oenococcus oeni TaxID=1247 RepID=UPI0008F88249|nr:MarR family transcriptional regulator [Oenococcus oeni]OIL00039.1 MarR family transcriptional regulator [Oenococcus oeni]PDH94738.1 MarR family transcriptional regulator [Oenococcus oeni]
MTDDLSLQSYIILHNTARKLHFLAHIRSKSEGIPQELGRTLNAISHKNGRCTAKDFAAHLRITAPSATMKINNLLEEGLVSQDHRSFFLEITEKGEKLRQQINRQNIEVGSRIFSSFSTQQKKTLSKCFRSLIGR